MQVALAFKVKEVMSKIDKIALLAPVANISHMNSVLLVWLNKVFY